MEKGERLKRWKNGQGRERKEIKQEETCEFDEDEIRHEGKRED